MLLMDSEIKQLAETKEMISPFVGQQIKYNGTQRIASYGLSSSGYDFRLAREFSFPLSGILDPHHPELATWKTLEVEEYIEIPPRSFVLGRTIEHINLPPDITALFIGKSTYARLGQHANLTPGEPGWRGYLTIELTNDSPLPCRVYVNEGVIQALFFRLSDTPKVTYADRAGKYQDQEARPVNARL